MTDPYVIHFGDCIRGQWEKLGPETADLCVTSIPFGELFSYSGKTEDIGNNPDGVDMRESQFALHMRFFVHQLFRVMAPGSNVCVHLQQLLRYQNKHGYQGRRDFRGAVFDIFERGGFQWQGEVAIPKNPQVMAKRLSLHSLQFMTGHSRDSRKLMPAVNDYVFFFQKPGIPRDIVRCLYHAKKNPGGWVSQEEWIRWASGCWDDIEETDVLENWRYGRDPKDEKHVCPLQLEVIRRCVKLYSAPGQIMLDPFMGIGSTAFVALEQKRRAIGFELKESYHAIAVKNCERALKCEQFDFDFDAIEVVA
jgi:DNA modification methylase